MKREQFLRSGIAAGILAAAPRTASAITPVEADFRTNCSLVLSGGGARGAYEVGAIAQMVKSAGLRDGEPFPGVDIICGTSIGALIGYFVATAQYSKLFNIWINISRYNFFQIKARYRAITQNESGIFTRVLEALRLTKGLTTNEKGILDGEHFSAFVNNLVDDDMPILTPFACTATSLTREGGTLFYTLPKTPAIDAARHNAAFARALTLTAGARLDVREAVGGLLALAIRASATVPIVLDPIMIDGPHGPEAFIEGGIAYNTPVDIARALSKNLKVILVDPVHSAMKSYDNAFAIGIESFEIAQRRILDTALRAAAVDTAYGGLFPVDIEILQPLEELPLQLLVFDHPADIEHVMQFGANAAQRGFVKYQV